MNTFAFLHAGIDFGYPWWLSYGHLVVAAAAVLIFVLTYFARARLGSLSNWILWPCGIIGIWALTAFLMIHFAFDVNAKGSLPTANFLTSGAGRVLDIGAGTGRSSIMLLEARPKVTLVALDLFGESFNQHFGPSVTPQQRLLENLRTAGVDQRATIQTADMRKLPFEAASFDGIISAYAIDHLGRQGIAQSLKEAARVIKPQGEFLLMVVGKDPFMNFAFGPFLLHAGLRGGDWWSGQLKDAGFRVIEKGMRPGTLYILSRRE